MYESVKKYFNNLLEQKGVKIGDLVRPGMSRPKASRIVNGHQSPSREDRIILAEKIGISFSELDSAVSQCIKNDQPAGFTDVVDQLQDPAEAVKKRLGQQMEKQLRKNGQK